MNNNEMAFAKLNAVARYMTGSSLDAYFLMGTNGAYEKATKERVIYLISKGVIANLRMQTHNGDVIIRGVGINLNTLPIIDSATGRLRNEGEVTENVRNVIHRAANSRKSKDNVAAQLTITKRILMGNQCRGYVMTNVAGQEARISYEKALEYAAAGRVSNATAQKITDKGEVKTIIRGRGDTKLNELPALFMDSSGKVLDPSNANEAIYLRGIRMGKGGIIHEIETGTRTPFQAGDFLVCGVNGVIRVVRKKQMEALFEVASEATRAVCDDCLEGNARFHLESYGGKPNDIKPDSILRWTVLVSRPREKVAQVG